MNGLKIPRPQGCAGSIPAPGTRKIEVGAGSGSSLENRANHRQLLPGEDLAAQHKARNVSLSSPVQKAGRNRDARCHHGSADTPSAVLQSNRGHFICFLPRFESDEIKPREAN